MCRWAGSKGGGFTNPLPLNTNDRFELADQVPKRASVISETTRTSIRPSDVLVERSKQKANLRMVELQDDNWRNAMKNKTNIRPSWSLVGVGTAALMSGLIATSAIAADPALMDPDADKILKEMSAYMGEISGFSADFDASTDIITADGQKIKLASSGNVVVNRPGQFRIKRLGALAEIEFILDGEQLTLYGQKINGYVQIPATSIDAAVAKVRDDIGFEVPGADVLSSNPFDMDVTDVVSGTHVGMTTVGGETVHHLAFRGEQVDWQVWVQDGNEPVPMKYVITSKLVAGAPEYSLLISNWVSEPQMDDTMFTFVPPTGAQEITAVTIDAAGNIIDKSE